MPHIFAVSTISTMEDTPNMELTSHHIKMLRAEIRKRRASQRLTTVFLPSENDESKTNYTQFLKDSGNLLLRDELLQVRGLSRDSRRQVKATADQLALDLQLTAVMNTGSDTTPTTLFQQQQPQIQQVWVVEIQGHTIVLYGSSRTDVVEAPHPTDNTPSVMDKIQLRTTRKSNLWDKRPRKLRDKTGQIIR